VGGKIDFDFLPVCLLTALNDAIGITSLGFLARARPHLFVNATRHWYGNSVRPFVAGCYCVKTAKHIVRVFYRRIAMSF